MFSETYNCLLHYTIEKVEVEICSHLRRDSLFHTFSLHYIETFLTCGKCSLKFKQNK